MSNKEPFTGFYSKSLKEICGAVEPRDLVLFILLSAYANQYGTCFPGLRELSKVLGWRFDEVRYRLDRLERQGLIRYKRRGKKDADTMQFMPDVYEMNPSIYYSKNPVTHAAENAEQASNAYSRESGTGLFRTPPSNVQHNQNHNQILQEELDNQNHNHHQQADAISSDEVMTGRAANFVWGQNEENTNTNSIPQTNANTNANGTTPVGTKTEYSDQAEGKTPPSSAPPPSWRPEGRYVTALADPRLEALANEVRAIAPTRLYSAREMVMHYGEEQVRKGLTQLAAAKAKGTVHSPYGLLTTWLRNGSVKAEPAAPTSDYTSGEYAGFIQS